jgi:hypothetical protein
VAACDSTPKPAPHQATIVTWSPAAACARTGKIFTEWHRNPGRLDRAVTELLAAYKNGTPYHPVTMAGDKVAADLAEIENGIQATALYGDYEHLVATCKAEGSPVVETAGQ